jgi:uncharacterized membrane protein
MLNLLLMAHLILIAMGTGMSFSNFVNIRLSQGQSGDIAKGLGLQRRTIAQIGDVVIALIWVTGLSLLWTRNATLGPEQSGWFYAKIAFVILLTASHFMARRTGGIMARTGNMALLGKLELLAAGVWLSALASIILAVIAFER